jgi:hypothetical protein
MISGFGGQQMALIDAEYLSALQISEIYQIPTRSVTNMARSGALPFVQFPNGIVRFHRTTLEALISGASCAPFKNRMRGNTPRR